MYTPNGMPYTVGDKRDKVPYYEINFGAAATCPSRSLGLCQCPGSCYADKAETAYRETRAHRAAAGSWWRNADMDDVLAAADCLEARAARCRHGFGAMRILRFSEAGDFLNQYQVDLFAAMARRLVARGWTIYGYTARTDLDLAPLLDIGVRINLSNDMASAAVARRCNRFRVVSVATPGHLTCPGDCKTCRLCRQVVGQVIDIVAH